MRLVFRLEFERYLKRILQLVAELYGLNTVHERIIQHTFFGKFEQWKLFQYLPLQANRDVNGFEADWAALLTRTSLEAQEVCNSKAFQFDLTHLLFTERTTRAC
jgi:hypothetical protein